MEKTQFLAILTLAFVLTSCGQDTVPPVPTVEVNTGPFAQFEAELEDLRQKLKIPAFSAAIVENQALVWAQGFGYAELENKIQATPDTPYHLASLTKPFAATIVMQLVTEGVLDLDDPVSRYGVAVESAGTVQVRHLLTMTSEGNPGERYQYNGDRFSRLSQVIEQASGQSFQELLIERILEPLDMTNTAPNRAGGHEYVYEALATPYELDHSYDIVEGRYPDHFSAAAGLISTVVDMAKFDVAIDQNILVGQETKEQMFAPTISTAGDEFPYGMGWHTQRYDGTRLIWHWGHWNCNSSLILKVPDQNITFVILANTDNLSRPYDLGNGDVRRSTVALAFLKHFVFPSQYGQTIPVVDWETSEEDIVNRLHQYTDVNVQDFFAREVRSYSQLFASVGEMELADQLLDVYIQVYVEPRITDRLATNVDPQIYADYVGEYEIPPELGEGRITVTRKDDKLYLIVPDGLQYRLFPQSETSFFYTEFDESFGFEATFVGGETGHIDQMVGVLYGQTFYFDRIDP